MSGSRYLLGMYVAKNGIDPELEDAADALLFAHRERGKHYDDGLMSYEQIRWRHRTEVYSQHPIDPALMRGMYRRARNTKQPHLNSRDGAAPGRRGFAQSTKETD